VRDTGAKANVTHFASMRPTVEEMMSPELRLAELSNTQFYGKLPIAPGVQMRQSPTLQACRHHRLPLRPLLIPTGRRNRAQLQLVPRSPRRSENRGLDPCTC
jgi:hypothetical protein